MGPWADGSGACEVREAFERAKRTANALLGVVPRLSGKSPQSRQSAMDFIDLSDQIVESNGDGVVLVTEVLHRGVGFANLLRAAL